VDESVPLVMLTQDDNEIKGSKVAIDDYRGGYIATEHLLKSGHERIFVIAEKAFSSSLRIEGYRGALNDWGIPIDERIIARISASIEGGTNTFLNLYEKNIHHLPTAIFTSNDQIAVGVLLAAQQLGLAVPDDLSIIGFDDTILGKTTHPPLSTVAQPIQDMGREVVDILIEEIETEKKSVKRIIHEPTLIIRKTTSDLKKNKKK